VTLEEFKSLERIRKSLASCPDVSVTIAVKYDGGRSCRYESIGRRRLISMLDNEEESMARDLRDWGDYGEYLAFLTWREGGECT